MALYRIEGSAWHAGANEHGVGGKLPGGAIKHPCRQGHGPRIQLRQFGQSCGTDKRHPIDFPGGFAVGFNIDATKAPLGAQERSHRDAIVAFTFVHRNQRAANAKIFLLVGVHFRHQYRVQLGNWRRAIQIHGVGTGKIKVRSEHGGNSRSNHQLVAVIDGERQGHQLYLRTVFIHHRGRARLAGDLHLDIGIAVIQGDFPAHISAHRHRCGSDQFSDFHILGEIHRVAGGQHIHSGAIGALQGERNHIHFIL